MIGLPLHSIARTALRGGRSSRSLAFAGGDFPRSTALAAPGGARAASGAGTEAAALGAVGADEVSGLRARVSFLEDALARVKVDGSSSNGVQRSATVGRGDDGAAAAAAAEVGEDGTAFSLGAGATAPVRHDWTRAQIREIFETPLMELVFRAAATHRAFFHPLEVQQSTLLCALLGGGAGRVAWWWKEERH